jgi:hypothetical protein
MQGNVKKWVDVTEEEVWNLTAFMIFMRLVKYPKISAYWSRYIPYPNTFVPAVMKQNTFQDILRFLHFDVNEFAGMKN